MSFLLKLLWAGLLFCLAIFIALTVGLNLYQDEIEAKIADKVKQVSGRELRIKDGIDFKFSPLPTFYANNIVLENAPWGTAPWMLEVKQVEVVLSFIALAQAKLKVSNIKIDSPYFLFERKQGTLNWFFGGSRNNKTPSPLAKLYKYLLLDKVVMDNAQFDIRINPRTHFIKLNRVTAQIEPKDQTIALDVVGSAENRLIQAQGRFTDVKSLLLRETSHLQIAGTYGGMPVSIQGTVEDVLRWKGLNAKAAATVPSLAFFQPWNRLKLPDTPPIIATARLLQPKRWSSARLEEVKLTMEGYGGTTTMAGTFDKLPSWEGLRLDGTSSHRALPLLEKMGWAGSEDVTINAEYSLSGAPFKGLTLALEQAELKGARLSVTAKGVIDNLRAADTSAILITAKADSLDYVGKMLGKPWPVTAPLQATAELAKKEGVYGLYELQGNVYDNNLSITGEVKNIGSFATGQFQVQGAFIADDIADFNQRNGYSLPAADSTEIIAKINYVDSLFSADDVNAELVFGESTIRAKGAIENMATLRLRDAHLEINVPSALPFNTLYGLQLPELGQLTATALITGDFKQKYALNDIIGNIKSTNHKFDIKGNIKNLGKDMQAAIEVRGKANNLDDFQLNLKTLALPKNTGAQAQFNLSSSKSNNWSISDLQIDLLTPAKGYISGAILNFPWQTEYKLNVDIESLNTSNIQQLAGINALMGRTINVGAELSTAPGKAVFSASDVKVLIAQPNTATTLEVTGFIEDIANFSGLSLKGHLKGDDVISVSESSGLDFKPGLPFDMAFVMQRAKLSDELDFKIEHARLADSDLAGELRLKLPTSENDVPYLSGILHSSRLNIINLMIAGETKKLFSDTPFSLDWAHRFNASVELDVEDLNGMISNIKHAKATLKLNKGFITLPGVTGMIGEGELIWWLAIDSNTTPYNIISSMYGRGLDSQELNLFGDSGLIKSGLIDVDVGISGQGVSLAQMMSTAYGKLQLQLKGASLKNQNLTLFGSDLILGFLNTINPLSKQQAYLDIECGVIHFYINDGIAYADQGIAIKTDRVTVLGGGEINLKNENLSILIKPIARKGLGFSVGTIAKIVQIGGTIEKPKFETATSGVFTAIASIGAAAVSGGWTLLAQGLLDRNKANSNVCNQTLNSPVFTALDNGDADAQK